MNQQVISDLNTKDFAQLAMNEQSAKT